MTRNSCKTCGHKATNDNPALHCYMFKSEPPGTCAQHTARAKPTYPPDLVTLALTALFSRGRQP